MAMQTPITIHRQLRDSGNICQMCQSVYHSPAMGNTENIIIHNVFILHFVSHQNSLFMLQIYSHFGKVLVDELQIV